MKIAVISDIHANIEALETVLHAIEAEKVERIVCLGDVVGYGPDPDACVERIVNIADILLCGNHDQAVIGGIDLADFNPDARDAIAWTIQNMKPESVEEMKKWGMAVVEENWMGVHATPEAPQNWDYLMTGVDIARNFTVLPVPVCFVGHSHTPAIFIQTPAGEILQEAGSGVEMKPDDKHLINVGSVGQPRDGDSRAAYGVFDVDNQVFILKRVEYPILPVQQKMAEAGLPRNLIERLAMGF